MKKALKIIGIILLVIVILVVILIGAAYFYVKGKLNKINYVDIDESSLEISEKSKNDLNNYRNIAIFGIDNRVQDRDLTYYAGNNRTDCIIIASINKTTNEVRLVSVYRDMFVDLGESGLENINEAYAIGGEQLSIATINKNLDLNITEFVTANFLAVANLVDSIGGIELDITSDELKFINNYIKGIKQDTGLSSSNVTKKGKQQLNGVQAVAYCRIRYTDGGDHKRTERMRTVLTKCFEKLKTKNVAELNKIADNLLPQISTNIKSNEIFSMIPEITKYSIGKSEGWPYKVIDSPVENRWHGFPCSLETNVVQLHKSFFPDVEYEASDTVKNISERIKEVSGYDENSSK